MKSCQLEDRGCERMAVRWLRMESAEDRDRYLVLVVVNFLARLQIPASDCWLRNVCLSLHPSVCPRAITRLSLDEF